MLPVSRQHVSFVYSNRRATNWQQFRCRQHVACCRQHVALSNNMLLYFGFINISTASVNWIRVGPQFLFVYYKQHVAGNKQHVKGNMLPGVNAALVIHAFSHLISNNGNFAAKGVHYFAIKPRLHQGNMLPCCKLGLRQSISQSIRMCLTCVYKLTGITSLYHAYRTKR